MLHYDCLAKQPSNNHNPDFSFVRYFYVHGLTCVAMTVYIASSNCRMHTASFNCMISSALRAFQALNPKLLNLLLIGLLPEVFKPCPPPLRGYCPGKLPQSWCHQHLHVLDSYPRKCTVDYTEVVRFFSRLLRDVALASSTSHSCRPTILFHFFPLKYVCYIFHNLTGLIQCVCVYIYMPFLQSGRQWSWQYGGKGPCKSHSKQRNIGRAMVSIIWTANKNQSTLHCSSTWVENLGLANHLWSFAARPGVSDEMYWRKTTIASTTVTFAARCHVKISVNERTFYR